jgi:hypothetical protein
MDLENQEITDSNNKKWWIGFCVGWISGITYTTLLYLYFEYRK